MNLHTLKKPHTALLLLTGLFLSCLLSSCGFFDFFGSSADPEGTVYLYYLNEEQNRLETSVYVPSSTETVPMIDELIARQGTGSADGSLFSLLPGDVSITGSTLDGTKLILDFSSSYKDMPIGREALVRGGLVREFLQVGGVDTVLFTVGGETLRDSRWNEIGPMTTESFVENSAEAINAYRSADMTLYFADAKGTSLVPETRRVYYIGSEPLERAVVDELFRGPRLSGSSSLFGNEYTVLSVTTQDDTCYVSLGSANPGITSTPNASEEIQIYALVNSLTDTCGIRQVQITLDGESDRVFRENVDLSSPFTRDDSLVKQA